jgi:uncharacterized protein YukE
MAEGLINEIIDRPAIDKQVKHVEDSLTMLADKLKNFPTIKKLFEDSGSMKTFIAAQKEAAKSQEDISIASKKVITEQAKLSQLYTDEAKAIAVLNIKQQQRRQELKNEAKETTGLVSAYDKLSKQLNESRKAYKDLAAQGKENSTEAKNLLKNVTALDTQLKKIDSSVGQNQRNVGNYTSALDKLGATFTSVGQRILAYVSIYAIINTVKNFFSSATDAALEADRAAHVLQGTLDNLGRSDAFDRIKIKATELMDRFKIFDDEEILGVFTKLITYGKLTENQMDALLPVIINFAAKSGRSLEESATVIIKAIEGQGKALREFGIDIKDAKTESERLALIMDELGKRVNGAADAFGDSTQGKIQATKIRIGELKEEIGDKLIPVWSKLLNVVNEFLGAINKVADRPLNETLENMFRRFSAFGRSGFSGVSNENKIIEEEESKRGFINDKSPFILFKPADTDPGGNKVLGIGDRLEDTNKEAAKAAKQKADAAKKQRDQEIAASIKRAEEFRRKELEEIRKANAEKAQILKDGYKAQVDDEKLSWAKICYLINSM